MTTWGFDAPSARAYLKSVANPGGTMSRQGVDLAIDRLNPSFAISAAAGVQAARAEGIDVQPSSAYRPVAYGVSGYPKGQEFNSLHGYGLGIDFSGLGKAKSADANRFYEIMTEHGAFNPYGPGNRKEFNHYQGVPEKGEDFVREHPELRASVNRNGPIDLETMWAASGLSGSGVSEPVAGHQWAAEQSDIDAPKIAASNRSRDAAIRTAYAEDVRNPEGPLSVIYNRTQDKRYPEDALGVVSQGSKKGKQFDGYGSKLYRSLSPDDPVYQQLGAEWDAMQSGAAKPMTAATHFLNPSVAKKQAWQDTMTDQGVIGQQRYYGDVQPRDAVGTRALAYAPEEKADQGPQPFDTKNLPGGSIPSKGFDIGSPEGLSNLATFASGILANPEAATHGFPPAAKAAARPTVFALPGQSHMTKAEDAAFEKTASDWAKAQGADLVQVPRTIDGKTDNKKAQVAWVKDQIKPGDPPAKLIGFSAGVDVASMLVDGTPKGTFDQVIGAGGPSDDVTEESFAQRGVPATLDRVHSVAALQQVANYTAPASAAIPAMPPGSAQAGQHLGASAEGQLMSGSLTPGEHLGASAEGQLLTGELTPGEHLGATATGYMPGAPPTFPPAYGTQPEAPASYPMSQPPASPAYGYGGNRPSAAPISQSQPPPAAAGISAPMEPQVSDIASQMRGFGADMERPADRIPKGPYGLDAAVRATLSGDPKAITNAWGNVAAAARKTVGVGEGIGSLLGMSDPAARITKEINGYMDNLPSDVQNRMAANFAFQPSLSSTMKGMPEKQMRETRQKAANALVFGGVLPIAQGESMQAVGSPAESPVTRGFTVAPSTQPYRKEQDPNLFGPALRSYSPEPEATGSSDFGTRSPDLYSGAEVAAASNKSDFGTRSPDLYNGQEVADVSNAPNYTPPDVSPPEPDAPDLAAIPGVTTIGDTPAHSWTDDPSKAFNQMTGYGPVTHPWSIGPGVKPGIHQGKNSRGEEAGFVGHPDKSNPANQWYASNQAAKQAGFGTTPYGMLSGLQSRGFTMPNFTSGSGGSTMAYNNNGGKGTGGYTDVRGNWQSTGTFVDSQGNEHDYDMG